MEIRVVIAPELQSLDKTHSPYTPKSICAAVDIRPDNIHIIVVEKHLAPYIPLESNGAFDAGELVFYLHDTVKRHSSIFAGVSDAMGHAKG
jgi:hypothetical protein